MIREVTDRKEKSCIARLVLEDLTDWFGITESRERYISDSEQQTMFASFGEDGNAEGFVCLKPTGKDTAEIAVIGVLRNKRGQGIGKALFAAARQSVAESSYSFLQVKTVQMGRYREYDETNLFYLSLGFKEFEVIPDLWDENNPCQIYVMSI